MIRIGEVQISSAARFLQQDVNKLLPHTAPLILQQAPVAGFGRGGDVLRQVLPLAASFKNVQDAIENFPFVRPRPSGPCTFRQQGLQIIPLDIRHIRPVRLSCDTTNLE